MPATIPADTTDGHTVTSLPTIKRAVTDPLTGAVSYEDHPVLPDIPIHYAGGGGVTATHPVKKDDEGIVVFASRPLDSWHQSGGTQPPVDNRMHHLGDGMYVPGVRSTPRKLPQVGPDSHQIRSDDKKHVAELHPETGAHVKSADPSTAPASDSFDPFTQATKFFEHMVHPTSGIAGNATDGGTTHSHGVTHAAGAFMAALNALHQVLAHPVMGALLSAAGGQHLVQAHPTAGVMIASTASIALSAPSVSLPPGSITASNLGSGAVAANIGPLGGDLSGTLPNPSVVSINHVSNAQTLINAANDSAAATAGVLVGHLYRNGSILMVRVA